MSTVMNCYRINKADWWNLFDKITKHYVEDSITMKLAKAYQKEESGHEFWKFCKEEEHHISVQLFDFGSDWIFRVLETGYYFANKHKELFPELGEAFYDDRTGIPPEHEANKAIADRIDVLIREKRYFMAHIIDFNLLFGIAFDVDEVKKDLTQVERQAA